jgi:hypothetical protein
MRFMPQCLGPDLEPVGSLTQSTLPERKQVLACKQPTAYDNSCAYAQMLYIVSAQHTYTAATTRSQPSVRMALVEASKRVVVVRLSQSLRQMLHKSPGADDLTALIVLRVDLSCFLSSMSSQHR